MSTTSMLSTGAIPPEHAPKQLTAYAESEAGNLLYAAHKSGMCLIAHSPNEWLIYVLRRVVPRLEVEGLEFLCCNPWTSPGNSCSFLFATHEIQQIIRALATLLDRAEANPESVAEVLRDFHYDADDVRDALLRAEASLRPEADDGEGLTFLFEYVKSLHSLCRLAENGGMAIVHHVWVA